MPEYARSPTTPRLPTPPSQSDAARGNRDDDFPAWAGRDLTAHHPSARLVLLASDGATSTTVAHEQLGRLRRLGVTPTLATVTMGGNDLLAAYGDAGAAGRAITTVVGNGRRVLSGLRDLMGPAAPIVVNRVLGMLAQDHQALVADVHAWFLGHGLAAGDPTQLAARPPDRGLWYCGLIQPNAWGASEIRASLWETLQADSEWSK